MACRAPTHAQQGAKSSGALSLATIAASYPGRLQYRSTRTAPVADLHRNVSAVVSALCKPAGPGEMRCSTSQAQCATAGAGRPRALVVRAAGGKQRSSGGGGGGSGGKQRRGGKQAQQEQQSAKPPTTRSKTLLMTEFKADEIIMFDPVPASRGALQVRPPAPPPSVLG